MPLSFYRSKIILIGFKSFGTWAIKQNYVVKSHLWTRPNRFFGPSLLILEGQGFKTEKKNNLTFQLSFHIQGFMYFPTSWNSRNEVVPCNGLKGAHFGYPYPQPEVN